MVAELSEWWATTVDYSIEPEAGMTTALTPRLLIDDPGRLSQRHQRVFEAMSASWAKVCSTVDDRMLELVVTRVSHLLDAPVDTAPFGRLNDVERRVLDLADQFVVDVSQVHDRHLEGARDALGEHRLRNLLETLYVVDQLTRLHITHQRLFGGTSLGLSPAGAAGSDTLIELAAVWHDRVLELQGLDWPTTEAARLRGAWHHTCRLCGSLRIVNSGRVVLSDDVARQVRHDQPSALPERLSGAVMFADAHVKGPAQHLGLELCDELRDVFSDDELLELSLDMTAWNHQKVTVSLRSEPPARAGTLSALYINDDGTVRIGAAIAGHVDP